MIVKVINLESIAMPSFISAVSPFFITPLLLILRSISIRLIVQCRNMSSALDCVEIHNRITAAVRMILAIAVLRLFGLLLETSYPDLVHTSDRRRVQI